MSGVAQRSWAGRHRRGSRCVPLGERRQGRLCERDIRVPACHNIWSIWQEQHCHKQINPYGRIRRYSRSAIALRIMGRPPTTEG